MIPVRKYSQIKFNFIANLNALKSSELAHRFNDKLEEELKKIYKFFVQQERELYLQINTRLHVRAKYETFSMVQLEKELEELQVLSSYATSLSCYIYLNITGMYKILKKFDKKFKRYSLNFTKNFIVEKYQKKNSDLLYIHQYKILDEVGACVEQLKNELLEHYNYLVKNPIKEINNARLDALNQKIKTEENINVEEGLLAGDKNENEIKKEEDKKSNLSHEELEKIKSKFDALNTSIGNMEAFYHSISLIFEVWMRYIKANEYKSHIYNVKSAREIYETSDNNNNADLVDKDGEKKPEHFLSRESYWNIRLILVQAFLMALCSTYFYPTVYYLLKSSNFDQSGTVFQRVRRGLYCGLIISMSPMGGLLSIIYSNFMINKSFKVPMISSSLLSTIGNILFIIGINYASIFLMCFGTLITGFSFNTPIHRQYLLYFIPKRKMNKYLLYFKSVVLLGNSAGPLLSLFSLLMFSKDYIRDHRVFNEYTFPSWICFISSLVLLNVIIFIFSEPLNPGFIVYAEGQAPTDTAKRADSFTLDDSMTIFESEKLNEINERVSNFNEENQYDDTNLVSSTINTLIDVETEPHGTVRKAFWVIMFYLFILNYTIISYITLAPSYLYQNIYANNDDVPKYKAERIISLLYFISLFLFVPAFGVNFFYVSLRINKILYIKILGLILLILQLVTTSFVIHKQSAFLYYFSFLSSILVSYIMEDQLIYFYTQIIPANFELLKFKGITILNIMRYLGNIIGSISSLFGFALYKETEKGVNNYEETLIIIQNSFAILIQFIILTLFFKNSDRFSDRPIRRLVYSKNIREIRRTEF